MQKDPAAVKAGAHDDRDISQTAQSCSQFHSNTASGSVAMMYVNAATDCLEGSPAQHPRGAVTLFF